MVKVIGKTQEEKDLEKKIEKLISIAKEFDLYPTMQDNSVISLNDSVINVVLIKDFMGVNNPNYFDKALKLAKKYEEHFGCEWTLKKNYD